MPLILDCNSPIGAHVRNNPCYLICLRLLISSGADTIFCLRKYLFSLIMRAQHVPRYHLIIVPWYCLWFVWRNDEMIYHDPCALFTIGRNPKIRQVKSANFTAKVKDVIWTGHKKWPRERERENNHAKITQVFARLNFLFCCKSRNVFRMVSQTM